MRLIKALGIVLLALVVIVSCTEENKKTDVGGLNLNGQVKSLRIITYEAAEKAGIIKRGKVYRYIETLKYDTKGKKIEEGKYGANGCFVSKETYKYNDRGDKSEVRYDRDSWIKTDSKCVYKYNKRGEVIEEASFSNGSLWRKFIYRYVYRGKKVETTKYKDGVFEWKRISRYDKNGNEIEIAEYNLDGSLKWIRVSQYDNRGNKIISATYDSYSLKSWSTYKYDNQNNEIEYTWHLPYTSLFKKFTNKYEYDKLGNWVRRIEYENSILQFITEREIEYYD